MKKPVAPIPLRSVIALPKWLMWSCVTLSSLCVLAGVALIVWGIGWSEGGGQLGGAIGGGFGCIIGGAGGLFGTLCDWTRRLPANRILPLVRNDVAHPMYRRVFWPSVIVFTLCVLVGCVFGHWRWLHALLQTSGILLFIAGCTEAARRHTVRQARAVFALYADGQLAAEDAAAIDDARAKDPRFDRDFRQYLQVSERVRAFTNG